MTVFENRSAGTTYDDHGSHPGQDGYRQQRAGLSTATNMMSTWTGAFYDYAEQVLKAQRQFADNVLGTGAQMLDVAQDGMYPDTDEGRQADQTGARSDRRHGSPDSNNRSGDHTSDTSRTEHAGVLADKPAKATGGVASAGRKRS
jgi:hypothetical protein